MKPFIAADILLPAPQTDMGLWPALACDQFTSQPEYWQKAEALTQNAPSTLHITLPEAYLESPDVDGRIAAIHTAMADYRARVLTRGVHGFVYVERATQSGVRRALWALWTWRLTAMKKAPHRWCVPAKIPLWSVFRRALPCAGARRWKRLIS